MDYKKRINILENQLNIRLNELNELKIELDFDNLIFKYKDLKKQIWKKENSIKKIKDNSKIKSIYKDLSVLNNKKKIVLKEFKKITIKEKNIYILKKRIDEIIKYIDYKLNSLNLKIKKNNYYLQDLEKIVKPKYLNLLEKDLIILEKEISSIKKDIQLKKSKKEMVIKEKNDLKFSFKKLFKIKLEIKKIKKSNLNLSNEKFKIISDKNNLLINDAKILQENINKLLLLIDKLNESLSFIDSDEISDNTSFSIKYLNVWYGNKQALFDINVNFPKNKVISIIGPSGCGKSTFLKTLNRINDNIPSFKSKGKILLDGEYDIYKLKSIRNRYNKIELSTLRTLVGMIFQQPNPFPMSIAKNVQYGLKVKGIKNKSLLEEITEKSLKEAGLWDEVKENLKALGTSLSGGQQQRLCIARAIANEPEIILMDEPTSALDPIASKKIEDLILNLKKNYTVIMVTHSMQQAQRISDKSAFFYEGKLIEFGDTKQIFNNPKEKETKAYVSGKFG